MTGSADLEGSTNSPLPLNGRNERTLIGMRGRICRPARPRQMGGWVRPGALCGREAAAVTDRVQNGLSSSRMLHGLDITRADRTPLPRTKISLGPHQHGPGPTDGHAVGRAWVNLKTVVGSNPPRVRISRPPPMFCSGQTCTSGRGAGVSQCLSTDRGAGRAWCTFDRSPELSRTSAIQAW